MSAWFSTYIVMFLIFASLACTLEGEHRGE